MYYVSGGVPVGLDGIPTKPPQSTGSSIALGEAFTYKPLSKSTSQGHNQVNGTPMHRSDSLESLLSLNVLASELLNDHDDLQGVDNCEWHKSLNDMHVVVTALTSPAAF